MYKYLFLLLISCEKSAVYKEPEHVIAFDEKACDKWGRCMVTTNLGNVGLMYHPEIYMSVCKIFPPKGDMKGIVIGCEK
jgi:hypothetical protein